METVNIPRNGVKWVEIQPWGDRVRAVIECIPRGTIETEGIVFNLVSKHYSIPFDPNEKFRLNLVN